MFRKGFLLFTVLSGFADLAGQARAQSIQQPNVIILLTDDQGYGDISCNGNPILKTPQLDRLAADGVQFADFHVDPYCSPTRAALMTGRYASRTGVWMTFGSRHHLRRDEVTIADVFKENGYTTAVFGKWHLGNNYPFRPMDRGFDVSLIHGGGVVGETPDFWDNNYYDDTYFRNGEPERVEGYCTDVWFNETMEFISENREKPFFVYLSTNVPHAPRHVPERYAEPYRESSGGRASFFGMIVNVDENLGKLRAHLQNLSLERNTILIFLNDNGTAGGVGLDGDGRNGWEISGFNAGMRGRKGSVYDGGHRAACFLSWPDGGIAGGREINGLTAHIDLMPTLIDLCGLKFSDWNRFDGISLGRVIMDKRVKVPVRTFVTHNQARFGSETGEANLEKSLDFSVMREDWRLVNKELYNLKKDPGQRKDLSAKHPEVFEKLMKDYETWWELISEKAGEFCPFVINPDKQREVKISSQNLLGGEVAYSQRHVRNAMLTNGWTRIDVEVPGRYLVTLRRWPKESGLAIGDTPGPYPQEKTTHNVRKFNDVRLNVKEARLKVGEFDKTVEVDATDQEVVFEVDLAPGEQRIQSWFMLEEGGNIAAYYIYIEPVKKQPNIVLFFIDDLGWSSLGYRQPEVYESPNIDRLAHDGLDFQQAYIASPTCSPSRSTLLTGKHPARLKLVRHITHSTKNAKMIYDEQGRNTHHLLLTDPAQFPTKQWVDLEHVSYAEALKELGYYNLFLGKWHLGTKEFHPVHQGFDRQIGTTDRGAPSSYYPDYFKDEDVLEDGPSDKYLTDRLADSVVRFIERYDRDQPFMVSFWSYNVHTPHIGREDHVKHFEERGLEGRYAHLAAMVKSVDDAVGRVRDALMKKRIDKETIIIFLSDQGGYFDNPPFRGGKRIETLYEGGSRVPFMVYWPGVTMKGSSNSSVVQSTDLFPTLVEIAGGDPSGYEDLDGVSLLSTIRDNSILDRGQPIYGYRAYQDLYASVREGDWKLLAYRSGELMLYNIANDIQEEHDLAAQEPEIVNLLKNKLIDWEKEMKVDQYSGVQ